MRHFCIFLQKNKVSYMYVCILPLHVSIDQNDNSGNVCLIPLVDTTTSCILLKNYSVSQSLIILLFFLLFVFFSFPSPFFLQPSVSAFPLPLLFVVSSAHFLASFYPACPFLGQPLTEY